MANNRNDSSTGIALALGALWFAFAFFYPRSWQASPVDVATIRPTERTFVLKLPAEGPLRLLLDRGSIVALTFKKAATCEANCAPPRFEAAAPTVPMPEADAGILTIERARVLSTTCMSADRQSDCYAVLGVAHDEAAKLAAVDRVWVTLRSPDDPPAKPSTSGRGAS